MLIIINKIFIVHVYCQLTGNGRWLVALSFSGLAMCGILHIDIWIGLSDVNVAAHREEIRFHEVALQFPEGAKARRTEPPPAPGDGRRRGGRALAPTTC